MYKFIPSKIRCYGNINVAKTYIGVANSQMEILKNAMQFQNLTQSVRRIQINKNIFIECIKQFDFQLINIHAIVPKPEIIVEDVNITFYLKITFNGNIPTVGGERIYFEFPNDPLGTYEKYFVLDAADEGILGPFIKGNDLDDDEYPYGVKACLGKTKYGSSETYFDYFYEVDIGDSPDYYGWLENTSGTAGDQQILHFQNYFSASATNYYKQVDRMRLATTLFNFPVIGYHEGYPLYGINFPVKVIQQTINSSKSWSPECSCNLVSDSAGATSLYPYLSLGIPDDANTSFNSKACEDGSGYVINYTDGYYLNSYPATIDSLCIISDENGLNINYDEFDYTILYDYSRQVVDDSTTVCSTTNTGEISESGSYTLENYPEANF